MFPESHDERVRAADEAFRRKVAKYDGRWMNDTRWRKVLGAWVADPGDVRECELKYIGRHAHVHTWSAPSSGQLWERGIRDGAVTGGPFDFREIEWMRWPRRVSRGDWGVVTQDVERLRGVILSVARPVLVLDEKYLWLIAYSRRKLEDGQRPPDAEDRVPMPKPDAWFLRMYEKEGGSGSKQRKRRERGG